MERTLPAGFILIYAASLLAMVAADLRLSLFKRNPVYGFLCFSSFLDYDDTRSGALVLLFAPENGSSLRRFMFHSRGYSCTPSLPVSKGVRIGSGET